jgi:hypothetical protein
MYDLSKPVQEGNIILDEFKFEEDIIPKFTSKYSASADFKTSQMPKFETFQDVLMLTPLLGNLGIPSTEILTKVSNFEAKEISYDMGTVRFDDDKGKAKVQLSLWYLSDQSPVIVEFDIDAESKNSTHKGSKHLEEFPPTLIVGIYKFYLALQANDIVDKTSPKTKTDYADEFGRA